jgi:hydrogenase small subunit
MLNTLYPGSPGGLALPSTLADVVDPANHDSPFVNPLAVVNDVTDLVVGDAVRAVVNLGSPGTINRSLLWSDDAAVAADGTLLPTDTLLAAYLGAFPRGYLTLEWNTTVMAAAGDIPSGHLRAIRQGAGLLGAFVLVVDGAIPAGNKNYCYVFDNDDGASGRVIRIGDTITNGNSLNITYKNPVSANEAVEWLAGAPNCLGVVSVGTCASFGGIPAGAGGRTGAKGVADYLSSIGINTPVINVPGCPPHPDWIVYPVAYLLSHTTTVPSLSLGIPTLDKWGRPQAVYSGSGNHPDPYTPFCMDCPNKDTKGLPGAAQSLGDAGCLGGLGCKGDYTVGDCPIRGKNTSDDGLSMNWCVGASGQNSAGGPSVYHVGEARHPCQGCIMQDFPDWKGLTTDGDKTSKRVKGFYNS